MKIPGSPVTRKSHGKKVNKSNNKKIVPRRKIQKKPSSQHHIAQRHLQTTSVQAGAAAQSTPTPAPQQEEVQANSSCATKHIKMQRDFSLKLYRSILRAHRYLPHDMRMVGDVYVQEEFRAHRNAKPQHLQPFYEQWIGYLGHLREAFQQEEYEKQLGENIPHETLDELDEEKREKLFKMHDETARLFSGQDQPIQGFYDEPEVQKQSV